MKQCDARDSKKVTHGTHWIFSMYFAYKIK